MKSLKQLIVTSMLIIFGLFVYQSEIKAQTVKHTEMSNLSAIKNKRKVYVFAQSNGTQSKIEQALKANSNLEIVNRPVDAEFFINESVEFKSSTDTPPRLSNTLQRLESPDMPQNEAQKRAIADANNPAKVRNITLRKTTIQVYFLKADGTKVIVWSKDSSSKVSSIPQTTRPVNSSTDIAPEVSHSYKQKDDAGNLIRSFVKKLKAVN